VNNIKIGSFSIGKDEPPFIIAELSGNHNQNLTLALDMVDAAADAGVHALKLQTYTADTMTIDIKRGEFFIDDKQSLWQGHSLYELYEKAHTPTRRYLKEQKKEAWLHLARPLMQRQLTF